MASPSKSGVTPEDVYLHNTVMDPQLSPDGERVAYVVSWNERDEDRVSQAIWVAKLDGSESPRRFTHGTQDHSPRWSPDGRYLAFISRRGNGAQLHLCPLDGGEARQLTKTPHGVSGPAWAPDGKSIAFAARTGEQKRTKDKKPAERT